VTCRLTPTAQRDLDAYLDPIERADPRAAARQEQRIRAGLAFLLAYPAAGYAATLPSGPPNTRAHPLPGTPLVAHYEPEPSGIKVLRLHDGRRKPIATR
jgi:plasmid stabilization system protein ParE